MGESPAFPAQRILIRPSRQFYDLIEIFRIGGYAPNTNYLFLGTAPAISRQANADGASARRLCWSRLVQRRNNIAVNLLKVALPR